MNKQELYTQIQGAVKAYLAYPSDWGEDAQIAINPISGHVSLISSDERLAVIADSAEAVEDLTGYERPAEEDGADAQVRQNPDLYPVSTLLRVDTDGLLHPDGLAIKRIANSYPDISKTSE